MPFIPTDFGFGGGGGGGIFGTGITGGDIASVIGAITGRGGGAPQAMPGGAPVQGFGGGMFNVPFVDIVPEGQGGLSSPWRRTNAGASAQLHVQTNPVTGRHTWFKPAGRPILFSGDLAACKRVKKVAGRARRAGGR